jgi:hypothetical protein
MAFAHLAAVLVEGDVAYVVEAVLDGPLASGELQKLLGRGPVRAATGQAGDDFVLDLGGLARTAMAASTLDLEDLLAVGERDVAIESGGGPDAADVDASVAFV